MDGLRMNIVDAGAPRIRNQVEDRYVRIERAVQLRIRRAAIIHVLHPHPRLLEFFVLEIVLCTVAGDVNGAPQFLDDFQYARTAAAADAQAGRTDEAAGLCEAE